jgi:hypothetical protein
MGLLKNSLSAIGRLLTVIALAGTFLVGLFGVVYLQLRGEEITIPKVVGKNFNDGKDELSVNGLRIKKIATRYSKEAPNTILEQRPKAGTVAKTGLMISVVVSEPNPEGYDEPVEVKDDEEAIEEIESLPELKTEKAKKKSSNKPKKEQKNRDVIKSDENKSDDAKSGSGDDKKTDGDGDSKKTDTKKENQTPPKPSDNKKATPKKDDKKPPSTGETRSRKVPTSNL